VYSLLIVSYGAHTIILHLTKEKNDIFLLSRVGWKTKLEQLQEDFEVTKLHSHYNSKLLILPSNA
jgi:hypothetical protein